MFDDCGCANKWEWVSVNCNRIGPVGRRREKPVGHSKPVCTCDINIYINVTAQSRRDQEGGGELDSHEEARTEEIKGREVVLGYRES